MQTIFDKIKLKKTCNGIINFQIGRLIISIHQRIIQSVDLPLVRCELNQRHSLSLELRSSQYWLPLYISIRSLLFFVCHIMLIMQMMLYAGLPHNSTRTPRRSNPNICWLFRSNRSWAENAFCIVRHQQR